jgi:uncharacterized membrane protein (DUF485 family)
MSSVDPITDPSPRPSTVSRNARYGIILFFVYLIIYATFVALSAFKPQLMAQPVIGGVNLAVVYGFGLIGLAFVLAVLYWAMCRRGGVE